ncbi:MAG: hypothetical protein CBB71_13385 [Rhodopirellula sp. TMED11]|nr:MAG: hypothetical protein CBB71_13385 [Rhodopirellula sp. TMED11]
MGACWFAQVGRDGIVSGALVRASTAPYLAGPKSFKAMLNWHHFTSCYDLSYERCSGTPLQDGRNVGRVARIGRCRRFACQSPIRPTNPYDHEG